MATARISCIMPVRNGERFLADAIASALAQTLALHEIMVVIDGGNDGSAAIAQGFGGPVRLVHTPGLGPAAARNTGIAAAEGNIITFLDCDDLWHPGKLEAQAAVLEKADTETISVCGVENFWMPEAEEERLHVAGTRFATILPGYGGSSIMAPRQLFERIGAFDPARRYTDQIEWIMRAQAAGIALDILPEALVRRRRHAGNMSRTEGPGAREEFLDLVAAKLRSDRASVRCV